MHEASPSTGLKFTNYCGNKKKQFLAQQEWFMA